MDGTLTFCGQADRDAVNIVASEGGVSSTVDHRVGLIAGLASAVSDPERSAL
jgi:hypothetical protein